MHICAERAAIYTRTICVSSGQFRHYVLSAAIYIYIQKSIRRAYMYIE